MQLFLNPGLIALTLGYTLSQFYRAFLAVLSPTLEAELGASPGDLALSSGMWFIAFALMQLPVGWALDRIGPRRTAAGEAAGAGRRSGSGPGRGGRGGRGEGRRR